MLCSVLSCATLKVCRVQYYVFCVFQDKIYEHIGKAITLSILHGGPGPSFFATSVVDYLFGGMSAVSPNIDDIPDDELRLKITEVALLQSRF